MTIKEQVEKEYNRIVTLNQGHVYVLECPYQEGRIIKVGRSNNWESRFSSHKTSNPLIKYIKHYTCDVRTERYIHKNLSSHLLEGTTEWFVDDGTLIDKIDKLVDDFKIPNQTTTEDIKRKYLNWSDARGWRVWKFESVYNNGFVFVIAATVNSARRFIKRELGLRVTHVDTKKISELNDDSVKLDTTYVYFNNIPLPRFKREGYQPTRQEAEEFVKKYDKDRTYWKNRNARAIKRYYK